MGFLIDSACREDSLPVSERSDQQTSIHTTTRNHNAQQALQETNRELEGTQREVAAALEAKSAAVGAMEEEKRVLKCVMLWVGWVCFCGWIALLVKQNGGHGFDCD